MKKIFLIIMILFSFTTNVFADDNLLINELKITNGEISPKYDKYNNYYSVKIPESINTLEFTYNFDNTNYEVKITNNENLAQNKLVYVTIYNKVSGEQNTYIFKIYIEDTEATVTTEDSVTVLNVETEKETNYAPAVGTGCFILIIFAYYLIFLR